MRELTLIRNVLVISFMVLIEAGCNLSTPTNEPVEFEIMTVPSQLNATQTVAPNPTKTPFPINTLTMPEKEDFIIGYLSTHNSDCKLPCWLGVTPGETTLLEATEKIRHIGLLFDSKGVPGYTPTATFHGASTFYYKSVANNFSFEEIDGVVNAILVRSYTYELPEEFQMLWGNYSLKNILKEYGIPDRVLLNITGAYRNGRAYHLWVFYDNKILLKYDGAVSDNPILRVCPVLEGMQSIEISLQDPGSSLPVERFDPLLEIIKLPPTETGTLQVLLTIQEATGMSEMEFHDLFMQEENLICFETPSDIWDIQQ